MVYDLNGLAKKLALKQNPPKPINTIIVQHLHHSKN